MRWRAKQRRAPPPARPVKHARWRSSMSRATRKVSTCPPCNGSRRPREPAPALARVRWPGAVRSRRTPALRRAKSGSSYELVPSFRRARYASTSSWSFRPSTCLERTRAWCCAVNRARSSSSCTVLPAPATPCRVRVELRDTAKAARERLVALSASELIAQGRARPRQPAGSSPSHARSTPSPPPHRRRWIELHPPTAAHRAVRRRQRGAARTAAGGLVGRLARHAAGA